MPVAGLRVRLDTVRVTSTQYRTTGADGGYQFTNLPAGPGLFVGPDASGSYSFAPTHRIYSTVVRHIGDADFVASVPTPLTNLALGKTATQSSDYGAPNARLAVDDNTNGNYSAGSVTHTLQETGS